VIIFEILNPFNITQTDEAMLFKFGKWTDYGKLPQGYKISPERGVVWVMRSFLE